MKIMLTNDDGINSIGLHVLAKTLSKDFDVVVIAPDAERSACGHSISIFKPIRYERVDFEENIEAYTTSGTPADCVKLGLLHLFKNQKIDLVISGMNNGPNLGTDLMYSGTVSAAYEAAYLGVRSIATSLTFWDCNAAEFEKACKTFYETFPKLLDIDLPKYTILNYNYPANKEFKGTVVTAVGVSEYDDLYVIEEGSSNSVSLHGAPKDSSINDEDTDVEWNKKGYATISPVYLDKNDYATLKTIKGKI